MTTEQMLAAALADWGLSAAARERLAGDVSHRRYERVRGPELAALGVPAAASAVLMVSPPEEEDKRLSWLKLGGWLAAHQVPVPAVYQVHPPTGIHLIADVGDRLLVDEPDQTVRHAAYLDTLGHLARLEQASRREPEASVSHHRVLDEQRLRWELRRFRKVVAGWIQDLDDAELAAWKQGEDALVAALLGGPQAWMHRDLHSRNLLLADGRVWWIDFQDAMVGPWLYDLVSLLYDPYADLPETTALELRAEYLGLAGRVHQQFDAAAVERQWWLCAVQRLVHCVACYVWVHEHGGRDTYLPYLPAASRRLQTALEACGSAAPLAAVMRQRWAGLAARWCADPAVC